MMINSDLMRMFDVRNALSESSLNNVLSCMLKWMFTYLLYAYAFWCVWTRCISFRMHKRAVRTHRRELHSNAPTTVFILTVCAHKYKPSGVNFEDVACFVAPMVHFMQKAQRSCQETLERITVNIFHMSDHNYQLSAGYLEVTFGWYVLEFNQANGSLHCISTLFGKRYKAVAGAGSYRYKN